MNKRQKLVQEAFINNEEAVIKRLKQVYNKSLEDINEKSKALQDEINSLHALADLTDDENEKAVLKSREQSKIYQKQYQDALKKQVGSILDNMQVEEFKTVSEYLRTCYEDGFVGTMYDLQGQGIPLCFPLDQEAMVRAVQLDSKISQGLYERLGEDVSVLKKKITAQVSRGISTGMTYAQVAKQLSSYTNIGFNNAVRIARTEGHRIQAQSTMDACYKAKDRGADIVKKWDATLDAKTRDSHVMVDGEIKELDEKFSNGLMFPGDPSGGAAEVVNCRCALLQKARWALEGSFTKMNNFTKQLETFESPEDYAEFKKAFFSKENKDYMKHVQDMEDKYKTKDFKKLLNKMSDKEFNHMTDLQSKSPLWKGNLTKKGKNDKILAKKLDENNFPTAFLSKGEKENTKKLVDYVNNLDGANPNTMKLYNNIGKLESVESQGIPFKITHGKNHKVAAKINWHGDLEEVQLVIPKLSGEDLVGQVNTTLHENMHLMDLYLRKDKTKCDNWFSSSRKDLADVFARTDASVSDDVKKIFDDFGKEYHKVGSQLYSKYNKLRDDLRDSYYPNGLDWNDWDKYKKYEKEVKKLAKMEFEESDYIKRNLCGGGVSELQDIYDALSHGQYRDKGIVLYGHGSKYYSQKGTNIEETLANYGALSVTRPDLVEILRKDKPELVEALEKTVDEMLNKVGV